MLLEGGACVPSSVLSTSIASQGKTSLPPQTEHKETVFPHSMDELSYVPETIGVKRLPGSSHKGMF